MIDTKTCKFVVWGFKNSYDTFRHIHEAWYRALKYKFYDRSVLWLDGDDDISQFDFSNTLFLTMNMVDLSKMPKRKDCFYVIHNTDERVAAAFGGDLSQYSVMNYGLYTSTTKLTSEVEIGMETYFSSQLHAPYSCTILRWGTDLFPHEIMANKPTEIYNRESKEVNFVGTVYENVHGPFRKACLEKGINFNSFGGFTGQAPVSIEENQWLVRASHMAPAIGDKYHSKVGYIPCRTYKNISYGCMPLTNNPYAQEFFKGRLIFNEDTYQLFYDARKRLPEIELGVLHELMDEVAANHTYLTKIDSLLTGVNMTQEQRG